MEFEYVLIFIGIALALILLYYGFTRFIKNKDLKQEVSSTVDIQKLLEALGGKDNITAVKSSPSKLIVEGKDNLSMIFGKQSVLIEDDLRKYL